MALANLDLVRLIRAAHDRGDFSSAEWAHPEIEFVIADWLDNERVLVFLRFSGRGKTSGLEVGPMRTKAAELWHIRDGKVTRLVLYFDRGRALADLGLAPEAGSPPS